jgi:hypothetical protein
MGNCCWPNGRYAAACRMTLRRRPKRPRPSTRLSGSQKAGAELSVPTVCLGNSRLAEEPDENVPLDLLQSVIGAGNDNLRFSEEFADPLKLLQVSERMGLEGIVSKRTEQPYVSGKNRAG